MKAVFHFTSIATFWSICTRACVVDINAGAVRFHNSPNAAVHEVVNIRVFIFQKFNCIFIVNINEFNSSYKDTVSFILYKF